MTEPSTRWKAPDFTKLATIWSRWMRDRWAAFRAAPGKLLWPVGVGVGLIAAVYYGLTAFLGGEESYAEFEAPAAPSSWLSETVRSGALIVLAVAMLAAFTWLLQWLRAQGLTPRLWTVLKVALALTPVSVWVLANLDGVYRPMQEPLRSYLLLIACPFVAGGLLVALDRRRALPLAMIATLGLAALFLGAGAIGQDLFEPVEHLRAALLALAPDQRMWWLALAASPVAIFALVSAVGDRPDEQA